MACQMEQAVYEEVLVDFVTEDGSICLQAFSSFLSFPGFLAAMEDKQAFLSTADEVVVDDLGHDEIAIGKHREIFHLKKGDVVVVKEAGAQQHFTRPPARYSEGLLVKAMEELGIGRPSTYATMLKTLESRKYVKIDHHRIIPEVRGRMVATFLSHFFPKYIDYSFTARLEEQLDEVSGGQVEWKEVLKQFWPEFEGAVASSIKIPIQEVVEMLQKTLASHCFKGLGINGHSCPSCGHGKLALKLSRYGSGYFFGCNSYPDCSFKAQVLSNQDVNSSLEEERESSVALKMIEKFDVLIGLDPDTNLEVRVKKGPFGYYIQLGLEGKQRRCFKLPEGVNPTDLTLEKAKELMKYPKILGTHPDDGEQVTLGIGKKLFYIRHRNAMASVPKGVVIDDVTVEMAIELLKGKGVTRTGRKSRAVLAAEEKERSIKQRKTQKKGAVVAVKPETKKVTKPSTDKVEEGEPKAENLPLGKKSELVAASEKAKKFTERKKVMTGMSEDVKLEANVASPKMQNEVTAADKNGKSNLCGKKEKIEVHVADQGELASKKAKKSTGRKKVMTGTSEDFSLEENVRSPTMQNEVTAADKKAKSNLRGKKEKVDVHDDGLGELVPASEKAKKSAGRRKAMIGTSEDVGLQANVASPTMQNEVTATDKKGKSNLRGKMEKMEVHDDDLGELDAKKAGKVKSKAVAAPSGKEEMSRGKSTQTLAGGEEGKVNVKRSSKQVKIEAVPPVERAVRSARRVNEKPSTDEGEGNKSTKKKKEKVARLGENT